MRSNVKMLSYSRPSGLTVLEVLMGLAALAVIAVLVVPNAHNALHEKQLRNTAEYLVEDLNQALTEAAKRGGIARLCPSSNGQTCRMNSDWHMGWVVFLDGNGDGQVQEFERIDSTEISESRIDIRVAGSVDRTASFNVSGLTDPLQDKLRASANGEFHICYRNSSAEGRRVIIEPDGWVIDEPLSPEACNAAGSGSGRAG